MVTLLAISFRDLVRPEFYINKGGRWVMLFVVFVETALMVGFFLPDDSLLFVARIYSQKLIDKLITGGTGSDLLNLIILWILVSVCGIVGNMVGYWFGKKSGDYLFT